MRYTFRWGSENVSPIITAFLQNLSFTVPVLVVYSLQVMVNQKQSDTKLFFNTLV